MKNLISILFLVFSASDLFSQSTISGTIFQSKTNVPLKGANIQIESEFGNKYGASSNNKGDFSIVDVLSGDYTMSVSFIGFETYKESISVIKANSYTKNISLAVEPILMTKLEIISEADVPYRKIPGAATVLDKLILKTVNPIGTQEMLEYVPGINGFADDGIGNSRISIGIRGLNPRRSSRVLILEDGIPIQPALYVYPNMYYNPPAERIDQIEVIKGSGSILYGPQTMGGVINYFTKKPRNEFGGKIKLTAGENGYSSIFTEIGGWGSGKIRPEIQLLLKRGDGFRQNNSFEQLNSTLKLNYRKSQKKNLYLKANLNYEDSQATYTGLTKWSFDNDPKFNPKEDDNFTVLRTAFDLIQSEKINSNIFKSTTAFFSFFDRKWWRENDIFIDVNDLNEADPTAQNHWSFLDLARVGNGKDNFGILRTFYVGGFKQSYNISHELFGGKKSKTELGWRVYWEKFIDDRKTGFTSDSLFATDARQGVYFRGTGDSLEILGTSHHYETTAFSFFLANSIKFNTFQINPGLRLEAFEQERVDRLAGSTYQDNTIIVALPGISFSSSIFGNTVFGGIHRGFTPPSSGALKILNFGELINGSGLDLEAEKSWNKELGFRRKSKLIDYEVAAFHIGIENLVAAGRGTAFKNLGKVNNRGVETRFDFTLHNLNRFLPNIRIAYTYLSTEIIDGIIQSNIQPVGQDVSIKGKQLPYSPNHTLNLGSEFIITSNYVFRFDYKYVGKSYTDFQNIEVEDKTGVTGPVPAYSILNISGNFKLNKKLKLFFTGKNISDEKYIGSRLHSNPGQKDANISSGILPGPRRQVNFGINYNF